MEKCFLVDFWDIFNGTGIRHLDLQSHFEIFQKCSRLICLYLRAKQNVTQLFEKSKFLKICEQKPVFTAYSNISAILVFLKI
jgi:hypothetical protein